MIFCPSVTDTTLLSHPRTLSYPSHPVKLSLPNIYSIVGDYSANENVTIEIKNGLTITGINCTIQGITRNTQQRSPVLVFASGNSSTSAVGSELKLENVIFKDINIVSENVNVHVSNCEFNNQSDVDLKLYKKSRGSVVLEKSFWLGDENAIVGINGNNCLIKIVDSRIHDTTLMLRITREADVVVSNSHFSARNNSDRKGLQVNIRNMGYGSGHLRLSMHNSTFTRWGTALEVDLERIHYDPCVGFLFHLEIFKTVTRNKQAVLLEEVPSRNTTIKINNSIFLNNVGNRTGGAVSVFLAQAMFGYGAFVLTESFSRTFQCQSDQVRDEHNSIEIINSSFLENHGSTGGALNINCSVSMTTAYVDIIKSEFVNNRVIRSGGGISCHNCRVNIENTTFRKNSASVDGGAVFVTEIPKKFDSRKQIELEVGMVSPELYNEDLTSLNIVSSTFVGNKAKGSGGAIFSEYQTAISGDTFTNDPHNARKSSVLFTDNLAGKHGGAICVKKLPPGGLTINGVQCIRNAAEFGGCISMLGSLVISKTTMIGNRAGEDGAAMVVTSGNIQLRESQFSDNFAAYGGVLVYTYNLFDVQMESKIEKNVHFHSANIIASTFDNNTATFAGGAFLIAAIKGQIINIAPVKPDNGNSTTADIYRHQFLLRVSDSNLTRSQARFGGVLYGTSGNVLFNDCRVESNSADAGGACYCRLATCSLNSSTIQHNLASVEGGVIMQEKQYLPYTIEHTFFWNNSVLYGGVLSTKSDIRILNCTFRANVANDGGALVLNVQNLNEESIIFNSSFANHVARSNGGAIVLNGGRIKIFQCHFEKNSAFNEGGALVLNSKTLDLYCSVIQCDYLHNSATTGGAMAIEGGYLTIFESNFNNKANTKVAPSIKEKVNWSWISQTFATA